MIDMTVKPRFGGLITADEVCLPVTAGGVLPCGASGRWRGRKMESYHGVSIVYEDNHLLGRRQAAEHAHAGG